MAATLNGHRITDSRTFIPAWGCWHSSVDIDGEVPLAPGSAVTLVIADLTLVGTVLSGGVALGRSFYRVVAGAGGWGKSIPPWSYSDDAGVKLATAIGDAAREAGETLETVPGTRRTGPNWAREAGPASQILNTLVPAAWYVDEAGVTRLGARAPGALPAKVTRVSPVDFARGRVELASDSIATILPGVVVDGLTAVDVVHETSADGGLRTTVYGGPTGSAAEQVRRVVAALDPNRDFRSPSEYRVDIASGNRLHLQPLRSSMPYLKNVPVRPGVAGCDAEVALGSFVVVSFIDADPSKPFVSGFADVDADRFQPSSITLSAGGMAGTEHLMTVEACVVLLHNLLASMALITPGPWTGVGQLTTMVLSLQAAIAAQGIPAPPTLIAQIAAAPGIASSMTSGLVGNTSALYTATIAAALSGKIADDSGLFPSIGVPAVKAG